MSFPFDPLRHVGYASRSPEEASLVCHPTFNGNLHAQQNLHMGSSSPFLGRYSPRESFPTGTVSPHQLSFSPASMMPIHNFSSTRIMYPSSSYIYGNPGYYYDPLHHPHSIGTQTTGSPYSTRDVPHIPTCMYPTMCPPGIPTIPPSGSSPFVDPSTNSHPPGCTYQEPSPDNFPQSGLPSSQPIPTSPLPNLSFGIPYGNPYDEGVSPSLVCGVESAPDFLQHLLTRETVSPGPPTKHVGRQVSSMLQPVLLKDLKKLSIPFYDPSKTPWHTFSMKLHATLIDCNMDYLLSAQTTNAANSKHSKELMMELYKKLQGGALVLFSSLHAQQFYLGGGRGIEMIRALADKFNPLDAGAVQSIMSTMQNLTLLDTEDLSVFKDKLENLNLQLTWVGQGMSDSDLVYLAQLQLKTFRYKSDIEALQISNTAAGNSFHSLSDLYLGLERLDRLQGLPYGGADTKKSPDNKSSKANTSDRLQPKYTKNVGIVASVVDVPGNSSSSDYEFHSETWIGAINLTEEQGHKLHSMFKCPQCRSNSHTLPACPLMKNWVITKKPQQPKSDNSATPFPSGSARSAIVSPNDSIPSSPP
jgi:hypothetical protein